MKKQLHPTLYKMCNYLPILGFKLTILVKWAHGHCVQALNNITCVSHITKLFLLQLDMSPHYNDKTVMAGMPIPIRRQLHSETAQTLKQLLLITGICFNLLIYIDIIYIAKCVYTYISTQRVYVHINSLGVVLSHASRPLISKLTMPFCDMLNMG